MNYPVGMPEINNIYSVPFLQQRSPITAADTRSQWMILRKGVCVCVGGGVLRREDFSENNVISKLCSNTYVKQCACLDVASHLNSCVRPRRLLPSPHR